MPAIATLMRWSTDGRICRPLGGLQVFHLQNYSHGRKIAISTLLFHQKSLHRKLRKAKLLYEIAYVILSLLSKDPHLKTRKIAECLCQGIYQDTPRLLVVRFQLKCFGISLLEHFS